jgi:hypothetical protein
MWLWPNPPTDHRRGQEGTPSPRPASSLRLSLARRSQPSSGQPVAIEVRASRTKVDTSGTRPGRLTASALGLLLRYRNEAGICAPLRPLMSYFLPVPVRRVMEHRTSPRSGVSVSTSGAEPRAARLAACSGTPAPAPRSVHGRREAPRCSTHPGTIRAHRRLGPGAATKPDRQPSSTPQRRFRCGTKIP